MLMRLVGTLLGFLFETPGLAGRMRQLSVENGDSVVARLLKVQRNYSPDLEICLEDS